MNKKLYALISTVMTVCGINCSAQTVSGQMEGHDYVDLGLPSGTLWATYNVGATQTTEHGDYFAWGETKPKKEYNWKNYKWSERDGNHSTKYNSKDNKTRLDTKDDAATQNWGEAWRMPTKAEGGELYWGCEWKYVEDFNGSGVNGHLGTSKTNGATIFLPTVNSECYYWIGSCYSYEDQSAHYFYYFDDSFTDGYNNYRYFGRNIRAVVK